MEITDAAERQILGVHVDCRKVIAALKLARWEATKWTVTVNLALAAASKAFGDERPLIAGCAVFVCALGLYLVWHYNDRVTKVRKTFQNANDFVRANIVDFGDKLGERVSEEKTREYDVQELIVFGAACVASILPPLAMLFVPIS